MGLTKAQINQILEEEMRAVLKEGVLGTFKGAFPPLGNANAFVKRFAGKGVHDTTIMESDLWSFFSALDRVTNEKVRKEIIELTGWQFERLSLVKEYVGRTMTLPKSIGYFSNMEELVITGHSFQTIPDSFENLVNLKKLNLANNEIEKLPWFLVKHPSLKKVELYGNPIRKELVEKRSEWLKQFEPKKKGFNTATSLDWEVMGEWLQDVDYWTTKGRDLMEDELPANFWEKIAEPEEKKAAEEEVEQIKLRTTKEREPIDYKEMEKQAEEQLDAEIKEAAIGLKNRMTFMRAMYGMPLKPKKAKKLSPEVKQKIVDLEIKAQEIAQKIAEEAFQSKDVLMIAAMGFTKRQAQGLANGVVPKELEDKDIMKMAIKGLLNAEKGALGAEYSYDFNPVDDDPPARELDIEYLLRKSLKLGKQYKGRDLKIDDGEMSVTRQDNILQWLKLEIGTTGHSYLHRRKFDETKWNWVDMSEEQFDQKLYDSFIKAKAIIQLKKLKKIDDSQWVGREKHWRPSGFGMLLTLGSLYQDHHGLYLVRTEVDEKGWKESSRMNYDKENEQWDVKSFKHDEGYDKRKNLEWTLRRSHWWLDEKIDDDASWEHDGNVFWRFSYKDGVDKSSGGHRWTEYYEITYGTTWRGPLKGWDKVHKSSEYLYTDDEDDHYY